MDHELLILGAGPGGYEAAIRAAQLGLNVGLIERDAVGGTCLNRGCIPTKTLLHDAAPGADFAALGARKEQVVSTLRQGVEGLLKKRGVTVYRGTGVLTDAHTIEVDGQAVTGEKLLLAPAVRAPRCRRWRASKGPSPRTTCCGSRGHWIACSFWAAG